MTIRRTCFKGHCLNGQGKVKLVFERKKARNYLRGRVETAKMIACLRTTAENGNRDFLRIAELFMDNQKSTSQRGS